jgi:peptidyl-prolyl cis-trans isomerase B (cyclophilin B)
MKKSVFFLSSIIMSAIVLAGCSNQKTTTEPATNDVQLTDQSITVSEKGTMKKLEDFEKISAKTATISTNKGDIEVELYPERAPVTVASFLELSKKKFYDGIVVHRVEPGFVIQAGDPLTKEAGKDSLWGTGGPGYTIPDEFSKDFSYDVEGILAMAKTMAPNSGGSQFFITLGPATFLDGQYTVFGKVTQGMDVVKSIQIGDKISTVTYK